MNKHNEIIEKYNHLPFQKYFKDVFSENGEDGVIEEIIKRLGIQKTKKKKWCVEFGAWDGKFASNTFNLVKNYNFNSLYIEGDPERFQQLEKTAKFYPKITAINAMVSRTKNNINSLEVILENHNMPRNFDILSIDIDSYDLEVWESLENYNPKIVVIEINSSILPGIIWYHSARTPGNTFSATINVAKKKNYTLLSHTGNLIFIHNNFLKKVKMPEKFVNYPETLFLFDSVWTRNNPFVQIPRNNLGLKKFINSWRKFK
jgi:hypothetical protein